jgi:hypothetical protein
LASANLTVTIADLPNLQRILFSAVELLQAIESSDAVLLTDDVVERAAELRVELELLRA